MGRVTADFNAIGFSVNGVILGEPAEQNGQFCWDFPSLPDGVLAPDGTIVTAADQADVPIEAFVGTRDFALPDKSVPAELIELFPETAEAVAESQSESPL